MTYQVLARRLRPKRFEEVVGQEHVTRTLQAAIAAGSIAHAFLFAGPRGVGKTTTARLLAQALNCERGVVQEPCNECASCREIGEGRAFDVLEIDGASHTQVDKMRDLMETVAHQPIRSRFKIYIIDEVHMLSQHSFNALLKTLEEPPPHVKFIFATTDPHKVLPTVLSRCQRYDLRRIGLGELLEQLKKIARAEGVGLSDDALALVAREAEGSLRDAQSLLDQVLAAGEAAGDPRRRRRPAGDCGGGPRAWRRCGRLRARPRRAPRPRLRSAALLPGPPRSRPEPHGAARDGRPAAPRRAARGGGRGAHGPGRAALGRRPAPLLPAPARGRRGPGRAGADGRPAARARDGGAAARHLAAAPARRRDPAP